jgi:hypothetical protein
MPAGGPTAPLTSDGNPFGDRFDGLGDGTAVTGPALTASPTGYAIPHRGGLILVLGVLGWVISCPVFGFAAWLMGSSDLREMRCGRMDPAGQGITQAGYVLGMINGLLWIAGVVIVMVVVVIGLVASMAG